MNSIKKQNDSLNNLSDCIKILSADAVEAANSGHPGMPLGFSQVMTSLVFEFLRFNPKDPKWFNRDRLVLSVGHGSMLLYSFFYLTGYEGFTLDDIKSFRQLHSKAAGHPEYEAFAAIETTTGPLGQGMANAVGMAIAQKKYEAELGLEISNYKIYSIVGDGCLMEGVSYEAASLAGHLNLSNLIILFDDNGISIDGKTNLAVSEDHLKKFEAMGYNTMAIDGHDCNQIRKALSEASKSDKPFFIACKTLIGKGTKNKEGSEKSHGSPLGFEEIQHLKNNAAFSGEDFYIPPKLKNLWEQAWKKSEEEYKQWQKNYNLLPNEKKEYIDTPKIVMPSNIQAPTKPEATRVSSGRVIEQLMKLEKKLISGSADLAGSNGLKSSECKAITAKDFSGNFIHYGVRESAMAAIMNGLGLSSFIPVGGTFFVFSDYMRPAIRLAALMKIPVLYVMTHDSIGVGEDGPTHQPIEQLASFRAMPNINVFRPADFVEVKECYELALDNKNTPSMMVLSRQSVPQTRDNFSENLSAKGGYVIREANDVANIDITIFATGSEIGSALEVQTILETKGKSVRICSVPCVEKLLAQGSEYIQTLRGGAQTLAAIEAASSFGWHRVIGVDGLFFGMDSFGASAPALDLYEYFNLTAQKIAKKLIEIETK